MKTFQQIPIPDQIDLKQLPALLRQLQQAIVKAAQRDEPYLSLDSMNTTPSKAFNGIFFGTGAPTFAANKGSLYLRADGSSTSTRAYINTDGSTTWTSVTTAA